MSFVSHTDERILREQVGDPRFSLPTLYVLVLEGTCQAVFGLLGFLFIQTILSIPECRAGPRMHKKGHCSCQSSQAKQCCGSFQKGGSEAAASLTSCHGFLRFVGSNLVFPRCLDRLVRKQLFLFRRGFIGFFCTGCIFLILEWFFFIHHVGKVWTVEGWTRRSTERLCFYPSPAMQGAVAGKKGSLKLVGVIGLPRGPFFRMIE